MTRIVSVTIFSVENIALKLDMDELKNEPVIFAGILIGFLQKDEWKNLNGVGMFVCERTVKKTGKKSIEQRYCLTSLTDVHKAACAMRAHWGIKNNLHWVLDVILDEDYCLVRKDNAAANLSVLRKIVLNILKQVDFSDIVKAKKMPLLHKQHLCNKREDCLDRVLQLL